MAEEADQGGERTEEPSQRRLQEARERGQVPRSRELTNFATMIGGSAALVATGSTLAARMSELMRRGMSLDAQSLVDPQSMLSALGRAAALALLALLPIFGCLVVLVLLAGVALGGWNFSPAALVPDFTRLSPLEGVKRLIGLRGVTELGKALLKFVVVGGVCAAVVVWLFKDVLALGRMAPRAAIGRGAGLLCVGLRVAVRLARAHRDRRCAAAAVPVQARPAHDPAGSARRSEGAATAARKPSSASASCSRRLARRRMMHKVPTADVVIVNPTHFAVALEIRPEEHAGAAGGRQGRRSGRAEHSPHRRGAPGADIRVAEAGARAVQVDRSEPEIPAGLYVAVAQVLSYIFRIRTLNPTLAARMARPDPGARR